jgi:Zn-dependent protease with chaperone function
MTKLALVMVLILGCGCAHEQGKSNYIIPKAIGYRSSSVYQRTMRCFQFTEDNKPSQLFINSSNDPGAWTDKDQRVILTAGLFRYDDDTISLVVAHELSHIKLNHVRNRQIVSGVTTGIMTALGFIIPYAGYLNYAVNPAVTNNFSKSQEYDADRLAAEILVKCLSISVDKQIHIYETLKADTSSGGGFWSTHPSWDDRIANIRKLQPAASTPANNH